MRTLKSGRPGSAFNASTAFWMRQAAFTAAKGQAAFAKLLVEGISVPRSVGFFGGIRTENGRIDLKRHGLTYELQLIYGLPGETRASFARSITVAMPSTWPVTSAPV